mgnify:FL=1
MSCVSGHFIFIETNQGIAASAAASGATLVRNSAQPPSKVLLWVYWVGLAICGGCALSLASLEAVPGVVACTVPRTSRGAGSDIWFLSEYSVSHHDKIKDRSGHRLEFAHDTLKLPLLGQEKGI